MKQYQENEDGSFSIDGLTIPADERNRHYQAIQGEVASGEAEILPYQA